MATVAARQTSDALDVLANITAITALAVCQAMDLTEKSEQGGYSAAALAMRAKLREWVPMLRDDRGMSGEITTVAAFLNQKEPAGDAEIMMF